MSFTDVLIVPFFAKGGAEKYILSIVEALRALAPDTRLLVISTHKVERHDWIDRLPEGSVFLDLHALGVLDLSMEMMKVITLGSSSMCPASAGYI